MKKILIYSLAFVSALSLYSCKKPSAASSEAVVADSSVRNDTNQGMYEYSEEVPVPAPGQQDPSVTEAKSGKLPYVVDFSATWCGPCQKFKPYFHEFEETFKGQAKFVTVDIDENPELARKNNVQGVPTVIIFSDSSMTQELFRMEGFAPQQLEEALMENL